MSMVATRTPLTAIGMNGAGAGAPRRSARLSLEAQEDEERPGKRQKVEVKKPAAAAAENGAGKRTRGKGKARLSWRGCIVGNEELMLIIGCSLRQQGWRFRVYEARETEQETCDSEFEHREGSQRPRACSKDSTANRKIKSAKIWPRAEGG
jgi:hypothetical protein